MGIMKQLLHPSKFYYIDVYWLYNGKYHWLCGMYYGTHHGGLKCMFVDSTYLQLDDDALDDEDCN